MRRVEMLTITQIIEQGKTAFSREHLQKLIRDGVITGVQEVGGTFVVPMTQKNIKAMTKRQRKPKDITKS